MFNNRKIAIIENDLKALSKEFDTVITKKIVDVSYELIKLQDKVRHLERHVECVGSASSELIEYLENKCMTLQSIIESQDIKISALTTQINDIYSKIDSKRKAKKACSDVPKKRVKKHKLCDEIIHGSDGCLNIVENNCLTITKE